jgi:anti-sigma regulatory factor (Ser/Thr protein kinase)
LNVCLLGGQRAETGAADVALIISELVTKSVLHANVGPDETLTVECTALPDRLRITVTDPGSRLASHLRPPDHQRLRRVRADDRRDAVLGVGIVHNSVSATSVCCDLPLDTLPAAVID